MGFQTLSVLQGGSDVLESGVFDSDPLMLPLENVTKGASRMFRALDDINPRVFDWITTENITVNLHKDGVSPRAFVDNQQLSEFYDVLSTNRDRNGRPFVSSMEAKSVPVFATQYHPERPQFEFRTDPAHRSIPHTTHAVASMHALATFFVGETKKNGHRFEDAMEESTRLIYNDTPQGAEGDSYRAYIFAPVSPQ